MEQTLKWKNVSGSADFTGNTDVTKIKQLP